MNISQKKAKKKKTRYVRTVTPSVKEKLLQSLKYYKIHIYALALILIVILQNPITKTIMTMMGVTDYFNNTFDYWMIYVMVRFILWGSYIGICFVSTRNRRYKKITGRSYTSDHAKYHKSYYYLIDYFNPKHCEPHKLPTDNCPELSWKKSHDIIFGYSGNKLVSLPSDWEGNIFEQGPSGSGKSALALCTLVKVNASVLAIDLKGELYAKLKEYNPKRAKRALRFCPDDPNALKISAHFDPFLHVKDMDQTELENYLSELAFIIVADGNEDEKKGEFFSSGARKLFSGIALYLFNQDINISFPAMVHKILSGTVIDWVNTISSSDCTSAKEYLKSVQGTNEKNAAGCFDSLCTNIKQLTNPVLDKLLDKGGRPISVKDLDKGRDIYLQIAQEHLNAYSKLFTVLIQELSRELSARKDLTTGVKNRKVLLFIDELPAMSFSYKILSNNLSTLRSKGCITWIICQDYSQLETKYKNGARALIANCTYKIILRSGDPVSGKYFSDMCGDKKVLSLSTSFGSNGSRQSSSISVNETKERVFPPEFIGDMEDDCILIANGKYALLKKINFYMDE